MVKTIEMTLDSYEEAASETARLQRDRDEMLALLKAMMEAHEDQPIIAWRGAIHAAIRKAEGHQ